MKRRPLTPFVPAVALAGLVLAGASAPIARAEHRDTASPAATQPLSAMATLGKSLFYDTSLSASGRMSCASCHDPAHHYAPANALPVQLGGPHLDQPGMRPVPTLTYKYLTPSFEVGPETAATEQNEATPMAEVAAVAAGNAADAQPLLTAAAHNLAPKAGNGNDIVPEGGMFWDGRADTLQEQVFGPLYSPFEMALPDRHALYEKLAAAYAPEMEKLFGKTVLADEKATVDEAGFAIARYETEEVSFHPFTSKYDYYLKGQATLSPAEAHGLKLFDDENKGNCAACHLDQIDADGRPPMFTDFEYEALGVPRNPHLAANADPNYHDLGICGPLRNDDYARQPGNCGLFKTPTLRNVATRHTFFHNGVYDTLEDAVRFYVDRDARPEAIYPKKPDGTVDQYDDLPPRYRGNIDVIDKPFGGKPGDPPALTEAEIKDLVAFLGTLTDGYDRQVLTAGH
jgi:cytochrome c peroxidase